LKNLNKEYEKQKRTMESLVIDSKIALGGLYLSQGNSQVRDYEAHGEDSGFCPMIIYLSYLKSLNYFMDTSIIKHIDVAYDQLTEVSRKYNISSTFFDKKYYPELKTIYYQVIEKLEKDKDIELYSCIILYLNSLFDVIEHNNINPSIIENRRNHS
jgi:hypothetical protein